MTTLHDAVEIDRTEPGWLPRAWEAGSPKGDRPGQPLWGPDSGFLLQGDIPEVLEPFICAKPAPRHGEEKGRTQTATIPAAGARPR